MRWAFGILVCGLGLVGCDSGSPHFRGAEVTRVTVDGAMFDVRVRGELAEAVRRNPQYAPRLGPLRGKAGLAMQQVSGCRVEYVLGDAAVTLGLMDCDGKKRDWSKLLQSRRYECVEVRGFSNGYTTYECDPY